MSGPLNITSETDWSYLTLAGFDQVEVVGLRKDLEDFDNITVLYAYPFTFVVGPTGDMEAIRDWLQGLLDQEAEVDIPDNNSWTPSPEVD